MPFVITATAKDKTFLLADLIIDKVLINSASPIRDTIPIIKRKSHTCPSLVRVCDRKQGLTSVFGADEMCGGSKHRY